LRPDQRLVTRIPLTELWDEDGILADKRIRNLDQSALLELVQSGPVRFVVADPGLKLEWIPTERRFQFWKAIKPQITDPGKRIRREDFPNQTFYTASEWRGRSGECLILLEKHH
jgi:hypothetical protein